MSFLNRLTIIFFISLLIFSVTSITHAKSSVWKASKNNKHLFLGGTVHVLGEDDYPLPCEFEAAYSVSDKLFFETDIDSLSNPDVALDLVNKGTYPFGNGLDKKLTPKTLNALKNYISSLGLPAEGFMKYKPGLLLSYIATIELNRIGITSEGVDQYFSKLAKQDKKPIGYFEKPEEQIEFLTGLGVDNEEDFIQYILENDGKLEGQFLVMRETWRNGEIEALAKFSEVDKLRKDFPKVFSKLISERNQNWLKQIDELIKTPDIEYILVGALHMAEKEGLLAQLETRGYQIDQLSCEYK